MRQRVLLYSLALLLAASLDASAAFTVGGPLTMTKSPVRLLLQALDATDDKDNQDDHDDKDAPPPLIKSRSAHRLENGRGTFLGFRNTKDVPGWVSTSRKTTTTTTTTARQSTVQPLMPDGGLSPCVIRVLGVGGGGCNAVRLHICIRIHIHVHSRLSRAGASCCTALHSCQLPAHLTCSHAPCSMILTHNNKHTLTQ